MAHGANAIVKLHDKDWNRWTMQFQAKFGTEGLDIIYDSWFWYTI